MRTGIWRLVLDSSLKVGWAAPGSNGQRFGCVLDAYTSWPRAPLQAAATWVGAPAWVTAGACFHCCVITCVERPAAGEGHLVPAPAHSGGEEAQGATQGTTAAQQRCLVAWTDDG